MPNLSDPALTRALAEKVMGWGEYQEGAQEGTYLVIGASLNHYTSTHGWRPWRPLESMDDAMMVVEHLRTRTTGPRYWCKMRTPWMDGEAGNQYVAGFTEWGGTGVNSDSDHRALADSLPRAVCLAALAVKEVGE